ncbi:MAG TPA: hypothetical protein DC009_08630 [Porphyromonadaceae bacterium]|nr:hypothetical protein [Porphyromonadaceae bacterium]
MNNKITLPELVNLLSDKTGVSKRQCEAFLKSLFAAVSDALINQDSVKIKDLGTFKLTEIEARKSVDVNTGNEIEIAGHNRVTFVAAKTLAALINEPFEAFETVELADSVTDEMLADAENDDATPIDVDEPAADAEIEAAEPEEEEAPENVAQPASAADEGTDLPLAEWTPDSPAEAEQGTPEPQQTSVEDAQTSYVIEDEDEDESQQLETAVKVEEEASGPAASEPDEDKEEAEAEGTEETEDAEDSVEEEPVRQHRRQRTFGNGFVVGILTSMLAIVIAGGAWLYFSGYFSGSKAPETATVAKSDSIAAAPQPQAKPAMPAATDSVAQNSEAAKPAASDKVTAKEEKTKEADTKPSDEPVYDTITKTRYLTTMAKEHYGSYHLWPYIYEANKSLGHPDKIRPGTKVVIPPLSRYGVNPKNPDDIAKAKRKGAAIYARYEKGK